MVTVVGTVLGQVAGGLMILRDPPVGMVDPPPSHMGWAGHQLLETQVMEICGD